jgi:hypothetical protein
MDDGSIAPQQDVQQHEDKSLLPSAFARLNGKSAVHQHGLGNSPDNKNRSGRVKYWELIADNLSGYSWGVYRRLP